MRFFYVLAVAFYSLFLQADPWMYIERAALEKIDECVMGPVTYKTLETFYAEKEEGIILDAEILCIREIYEDRDAETLYEQLKPYYAYFIYVLPTEKSPGELWMSQSSVETLYQHLGVSMPEDSSVAVEGLEESMPISYSKGVKTRTKSTEGFQLCGSDNRNRVEVDASHQKNHDTGESEVRGGVKYKRECENGNRFNVGVEQSIKKDKDGNKTSETKMSSGLDF